MNVRIILICAAICAIFSSRADGGISDDLKSIEKNYRGLAASCYRAGMIEEELREQGRAGEPEVAAVIKNAHQSCWVKP